MIQQDMKFFRENFSASSLSDFPDTPRKQLLYQTKNNRLNVPQTRKIQRQIHYHREQERPIPKNQSSVIDNRNLGKSSQFKMLHKLKTEHQQIRHLNNHSQEQSVFMQQSDKASQPSAQKLRPAVKSKKKEIQQETKKVRMSRTDIHEDKKPLIRQKETDGMNASKSKEMESRLQQKDRVIQRLRNSDNQMMNQVNQSKVEIKFLRGQIDKLVEENTRLKKDVITKDLQNQDLHEKLKRKSSEERDLQMIRNREREYLQTIKHLQERSQATNVTPSLPNLEMAAEINYLKQTLTDNNQAWEKRLQEVLELQRKNSLETVQKLVAQQIPATPINDPLSQTQNFQQFGHQQRFQRSNSNQGNIRRQPQPQRYRESRLVQLLVQQLQNLRKPYNPIEEQLRTIKQSIRSLMRKSDYNSRSFKDLAVTTDSLQMVNQLENLKMYIIKQQNSRKNYNDQITFYRNQNGTLMEQSRQFKTQATSLQESLDAANIENQQLSSTVHDLRNKIDEKSRYIQELANSLANIQAHQIDKVTKIKSSVDKQRSHQLEMQVERLRELLQTQVLQLNKTHDDKIRGYQYQIRNLERSMKDQEQILRTTHQQLLQTQNKFQILTQKSNFDIAILRQANQQLQHQSISVKAQISAVATSNHQLQIQVKQRSHAVDHLWLVKQAEFDNVMQQLVRLKQGFL